MDALAESFAHSPELFPHAFDLPSDAISFIRLSRTDYRNASFLHRRILTPHTIGRTIPAHQVIRSVEASKLPESCHFIFQIGHVGSTLISRLLGADCHLFAVREPLMLRTFAEIRSNSQMPPPAEAFEARISAFLKLASRTFDPEERAVVKATSFASELASELMARSYAPKALLIFVPAESYLATIFGGPNSRREARLLAESRLGRLHRRLGRNVWRLAQLTEGEAIAAGWACEMTALARAQREAGIRALWLNFDRFLAHPASLLEQAFRHFDVELAARDMLAILQGPDMARYSKAPEHAYDAELRRAVLDGARAAHGAEIARGLAWLERAAIDFVPIGEAVALSEASTS